MAVARNCHLVHKSKARGRCAGLGPQQGLIGDGGKGGPCYILNNYISDFLVKDMGPHDNGTCIYMYTVSFLWYVVFFLTILATL